tara:strand:+ start:384 stop:752 length:369 start_codon:yes stop_codon:yes gene_type:complete
MDNYLKNTNINELGCNSLINKEILDPQFIADKTNRLKKIKTKIERMDRNNQIGTLYMIIKNKNIKYSENNNGTFINLSQLDESMLLKLEEFIEYIELQKNEIEDIEKKRMYIENIYFKPNKE